MVKLTVAPAGRLLPLQETVPVVAPVPGSLQLKPAGGVTETKLQPPLTGSVRVSGPESEGPRFVTAML